MTRYHWISLTLVLALCAGDVWALPRGSSGGGRSPSAGGRSGGASNLGGGGGLPNKGSKPTSKPSLSATPSFSGGNALGGGSRSPGKTNLGGNRPIGGSGNASSKLPSSGGNRPNLGSSNANLGQRPSGGSNAVSRPGFLPSNKPGSSSGQIPGNLGSNRPNITPGNRPNLGGNTPGTNLPGGGNNLTNRPNITPGNRPTTLPGNTKPALPGTGNIANRPNVTPGNRPAIGNRPNINTGNQTKPGIGNDTNIGNRPNINTGNQTGIVDRDKTKITNRPGINIDNSTNIGGNQPWYANRPTRPSYESRPVINNGNLGVGVNVGSNNGNRINVAAGNNVFAPTINNNIYNGPVVNNRPWYGQPWNAPTYQYHYGWHQGYWNYWPPSSYYAPAAYATGLATGWLLSSPNYVYVNPYCSVPMTTSTTIIYDYSQPIPVTPPPTTTTSAPVNVNVTVDASTTESGQPPVPNPPVEDPKTKAAVEKFDQGRLAFKAGMYDDALKLVNEAIQELPGDPVLHEFRGLVLFAKQDYNDAAGTIYAVLAAGPGWDWDTLKSLYPNEETYAKQLRTLEEFSNTHPDAADARFLLAYHYLTLGYTDEAKAELEVVSKLQPNDELSPQLVKLLSGESLADETESTNS
ncbi:tetratricopeptide repeat protein [bacterium]|nr:tetratricopeptide repeat protein [bacterium]